VLKFSPHLKSVAALPCETWNVKCVDIRQRHIQFKTDAKCQVTVLTLSSSFTSGAQNDICSYTGSESSRACHWSIASSITFCPICCATHSTGTDTARPIYLRVSHRPDVALQPRSYNQRGSYLGCLGATGREKWSLAFLGVKVPLCHAPCVQVHCLVGIWNCATWSESERRLLSWSTAEGEAVAMHQGNIGWQCHIPTGQLTCAQSAINQLRAPLTTDISSFTR